MISFSLLKRSRINRRVPRKRKGSDRKYLQWLRERPCVICFYRLMGKLLFTCEGFSEAAHVGNRGLGQRCPDREAVPMCAEHHRLGREAHHGPLGKAFWEYHGLDRDALVRELNEAYKECLPEDLRVREYPVVSR